MADNVTANSGSGGATFAADDIAGIHFPRTKIAIGADGVNDGDVSATNPLPVAQHTVIGNGTFAVQTAQHTVIGNGTFAVQATGTVTVVGTGTFAVQPSQHTIVGTGTLGVQAGRYQSVAGTLTDGQLTGLLTDILGRPIVAPGTSEKLDDEAFALTTDSVVMIGAIRDDALSTLSAVEGDAVPLRVSSTGALHVTGTSSSATVLGNGTFAVQVTSNVQHTVIGNGTFAVQPSQHTVIGNGTFAVQATGTMTVVGTGTFAVQPAQHTVIGNGTFAVQPGPTTSGGCSTFRSIDLDEGTAEQVKGSAGQIYGGLITNTATTTRWIKFYNATSATVGTTTPRITWGIPGNATDDIGAAFNNGGMGVEFETGICVGASTGVADADTGAPGANDVIVNLFYK